MQHIFKFICKLIEIQFLFQLADECREILKYAIEVRESYRQNIEAILLNAPAKAEQVEADLEGFETDMKNVLKVWHFLKMHGPINALMMHYSLGW